MKRIFLCFFLIFAIFAFTHNTECNENNPLVYVITIDDHVINPIIQDYIKKSILHAEAEGATCLIIQLDTPGGLLSSTRLIVKDIMNADVPIITYIAPPGARAGSAGVFITLASHRSAMAPSTNIGAAHPVNLDGSGRGLRGKFESLKKKLKEDTEDSKSETTPHGEEEVEPDTVLEDKILNDTLAWVRSIAETRGKNVDWAEKAVRESVSQTEKEALNLTIIDYISQDLDDLLATLHGAEITLSRNRSVILNTKNATIEHRPLSERERILMAISHPNIAYILMMLGFYGLLFEITHPGIGFPGIAGTICLIIAFFSLSTLPVNFAGLLLIILGVILFIAEMNVISYGLLTLGGLVCLFFGSLMLIDSPYALMRVSIEIILPMIFATAAVTLFLVGAVIRAHKKKSVVGKEGMIGQIGTADSPINPFGTVRVHGEIWQARSSFPIEKDTRVRIIAVKNLELEVEALEKE